jgi:hypothetical protein
MRPDAAADVQPRFEKEGRTVSAGKLRRGRQSGGACAYDNHVVESFRHYSVQEKTGCGAIGESRRFDTA